MGGDSFDFWLGTWDVGWGGDDGQRQTGANTIALVNGTIRELFTDAAPAGAYIGASVTRWDSEADCWLQDYWDNRGYSALFRGSRTADRMILERVPGPEPGPLTRLVWSEIMPDSLLWNYERQVADGTWESTWQIHYTRREAEASSASENPQGP